MVCYNLLSWKSVLNYHCDETYYTDVSKRASIVGCAVATSSTIIKTYNLPQFVSAYSGELFAILQALKSILLSTRSLAFWDSNLD